MKNLLSEWVPLEKEREKVDQAAESYKMKGYEWQMRWVFLILFLVLIGYSINDELKKEQNDQL